MKKILILSFILLPMFVFASYITFNKGAYSYAMGDAHTAFVKDASAVFINPAGVGKTKGINAILSHQNIFGVPDLYNEMGAVTFSVPYAKIGLGTNQLILGNDYSEQSYYLSASSVIYIKNKPVYFGFSSKIYHSFVNFQEALSPTKFDMDLGLIADLSNAISLGFTAKNIFEPNIKFLDYNDEVKSEYTVGLSYNWKNLMNLTTDYNFTHSKFKIGGELWFYNVFAPRIGLNGEFLTIGFGLKSKKWTLDAAILSHDSLGSNYRISLSYKIK